MMISNGHLAFFESKENSKQVRLTSVEQTKSLLNLRRR